MEDTQVILVTPRTARRTFTRNFKQKLVRQAMVHWVSRAALALANSINDNQLARWCREHQRTGHVTFVPVVSTEPTATACAETRHPPLPEAEIVWQHGDTNIVIRSDTSADMLRTIISQTLASSRAA